MYENNIEEMSCGTTQCVKEEIYTNSSGYTKRERVIQLKFQKNKTQSIFFFTLFTDIYYNNFKIFYIFFFFNILI